MNKICIFFSHNVLESKDQYISSTFRFQVSRNLGTHLCVPLINDRVTKDTYMYILEKVRKKLSEWKATSLSMLSRLMLAKSMLMALPAYAMPTIFIPCYICDQIDQLMHGFI